MSILTTVYDNVSFVFALCFNFLALYLIITRSKKEIGAYKYLLITFLCSDLIFSIIHKLCQPILSFRGGFFVSHCEGLVDSSFALTLYGASGSLSFPLLSYHFLYRAVVVSSNGVQNFRRNKVVIGTLAICLLLEAVVWVVFNYQLRLDPYDAVMRAKIAAVHPTLTNRTELIVIMPIIDGLFNTKVMRNAAPLLAISTSSFVIIIVCVCRIIHALYIHQSTLSITSKALHRSLFIALILQMLVPFTTMIAPSVAAISLPFFETSIDLPDWVIGLCYSLYPILDPVVITMCIRDYRNGLFQIFKKVRSGISILPQESRSISTVYVAEQENNVVTVSIKN